MKRTITLILALALLAACLTGCGSKQEVQFGADVFNFAYVTLDTVSDLEDFTIAVADCLEEEGITGSINDEVFLGKCVYRYADLLQEWKADGYDVSGQSFDEITGRLPGILEQHEKISQSTVKAENGDELREAAERLFRAEQAMVNHVINIYGPADEYRNKALDIMSEAADANSDIIELLQPYYQKPGFVQLQKREG